ncbi:vacuolar protein sorting-associated protein 13, partial [Hamiltosporidium tvaerminnensis]
QHPLNNNNISTNKQHPLNNNNISTNKQHPYNNSTNTQHPLNNNNISTNKQHPYNTNTLNNTPITDTHCCLDISVISIQIDNQTLECVYPIIFYPVNIKQRFFSESKDKRKFLSLSIGFYLESIIRYLTGDNNSSRDVEGDSDRDSKQQGVNNLYDNQQGVSNLYDKQQGVSNKDSNQQGVNNLSNTYHPLNNSTDKQNPLNNCTDTYHPLNNSTNTYHPLNNCTNTYNPLNNPNNTQHPNTPPHFTYIIFLLQEFVLNLEEDILTKLITFIPTYRNNTNYSYLLCNNCNKNECICYTYAGYTKYTSSSTNNQYTNNQCTNHTNTNQYHTHYQQQYHTNQHYHTHYQQQYQQHYHQYNNITIDTLHLHPLKLRFSFLKSTKNHFISYLLSFILQNISSLKLKFNTFLITNIKDYKILIELIINSYKIGLISQMYKIFGSLDFLGNLSSLVDSFSLGVHDLFYEPYNVLSNSNSNSIDFSIGILRGGKSFIKNTLSGVSNTVSRVTSSISKGVSLVSLDKDFNEKMNLSNNLIFYLDDELLFPDKLVFTNKYDRFVESCVSGVRGIVEKPMEGFKKGFRGFLVGVGKGIVGAVAKPVAGISDLACSVSEGVRDRVSGGEVVRIQVIGVGGYGMEIGEYGIGEYEIGE